jgi:methylenetetrahydrofolate--tRNA-(uracil-5-)-methyltransferase
MTPQKHVTVIGGGLAGCEACWQLARRNIAVTLIEMKPETFSPAHKSPLFAELVCSNSLKSLQPATATGTLKKELVSLNSLIMEAARVNAIPAGNALGVDRTRFSAYITQQLETIPHVRIEHRTITSLDDITNRPAILATGPLTHPVLIKDLQSRTGTETLNFYDATSPIVYAESLDRTIIFSASRYDKGGNDYLNIPLEKKAYEQFVKDILGAEKVALHPFESATYYEGCMPIEVLAERGPETLAFGPMKPVGLRNPRTGTRPHAVIQLRQEDLSKELYNMVGFQTKMTYPEQQRIFRNLPGMANAEFARLGTIHRNFYLASPDILTPTLEFKNIPGIYAAGQITGVEGYLESTAMGLLAALFCFVAGEQNAPPPTTVMGGLYRHITTPQKRFDPMGANWGLVTPLAQPVKRKEKKEFLAKRAIRDMDEWKKQLA